MPKNFFLLQCALPSNLIEEWDYLRSLCITCFACIIPFLHLDAVVFSMAIPASFYVFLYTCNSSAKEFRKPLYVHALWAHRRHPYIESLPTLCSPTGDKWSIVADDVLSKHVCLYKYVYRVTN